MTYSTVITRDEEVCQHDSPLFSVGGSTIGVSTQRQVLHELLKHLEVEIINKHCQVLGGKDKQKILCDKHIYIYIYIYLKKNY